MDALHVAEGTTVADLGAGGGWFTMRLARRVGRHGRVYAVDVQRLMIEAIRRRIEREGLTSIVTTVLGESADPKLPPNALDAVLIVDAFHEMEDPVLLLRNVARTLRPQGRIGIIDYREGDGGPGPDATERVPPGVVISAGCGCRIEARRPAQVSPLPVLPDLREVTGQHADPHANRAYDRRQRFHRRRRHSGRPQNLRGARRVRRVGS